MSLCEWRILLGVLLLPALTARSELPEAESDWAELARRLPAVADREVDFAKDVQPILRDNCFECHAGSTEEGGLNLAVRARAMKGGEHGAVLLPGNSRMSLLIHLVSGLETDRLMPPEGNQPLTADQVGVLRAWIDQGAKWPRTADVLDPRLERAQEHWAFARLHPVDVPNKREGDTWSRSDIDCFIAERLAAHGVEPSPAATAKVLARRLYYDLLGLPPTPDQQRRFTAAYDSQPVAATTQLIDELLSSHHFGERWGRHWLDLARYADSDGQESDRDRLHAYHYRDFVIQAFNDDMPYDQFVRWQIAGDEYEPDNDAAVAATGFLTAGPSMKLEDTFLERERLFNRYNELDDIISTLGTGLLGLTVGCARCHDHKYDAFSSREYYQLLSVFHSGDRVHAKLPSGKDGFFFQDFDTQVRPSWLFRRSDFYDREIEVTLGFPAVLSADHDASEYWSAAQQAVPQPQSTLQRRSLADWIVDVDCGGGALLARVIVNRIWQHHFGHGLVRTPSDFGVRGESPSHPDLLEYLAYDFVVHGWRMKRLHRKILNTAVWQQCGHAGRRQETESTVAESTVAESTVAVPLDPENRLLSRMAPQRLEAEVLRDAMLAVSGTLNLAAGGPGFKPYIPPEANLARNIQGGEYPKDAPDDASTRRRSVYMFHKRLIPYPLFQAFDRPDLMVSCARRQNTTVAPQAMAILNDHFVRAVASDFAKRLIASSGDDDVRLVQDSFELSFCRLPTRAETEASLAFIQSQTRARRARHEQDARQEAVVDYCHSLFGLNEFIYVD